MKILQPRLLAVLLLLSGELVCVAAWALTGAILALVAGVSVLLLALLSGT